MRPRASSVPGTTGASAPFADAVDTVDPAKLRRRLMLSQGAIPRPYGFRLPTLRNWERGSRSRDAAARAYLTVIARDAERVAMVFADATVEALTRHTLRELRAALDAADTKPEGDPRGQRRSAPRQSQGAQERDP